MTTAMLPPQASPNVDGPAPSCPYVGLVPFGEQDAEYFFGRERESEIIVANLTAARLTLLYAPSGVGKSSVLRAGVVPRLREVAQDDEDDEDLGTAGAVAYVSDWSSSPLEHVAAEILRALTGNAPPVAAPAPRLGVDWLRHLMEQSGVAVLYLVLDQFEEYFFYHPADLGADSLTAELGEVLTARDLNVHVLLSVREDALAGLDRFKGRVPHLFGNYLRLAHLTRDAARSAIEGPLERHNRRVAPDAAVSAEPALVEELLDQVRAGKVVVGRDGTPSDVMAGDARGDIETPYLQLVLTRLWEQERGQGSAALRRSTLGELGGAQTIVQSHLDTVMAGLAPQQVGVAAAVFQHLVTASGSKIALTAMDLAEWSGQPVVPIQDLLETLSSGRQRILRPVPPAAGVTGPPRYEIFHDVMGAAVLDWRRRYVAELRQVESSRRLVAEREQARATARTARRQLRLTLLTVGLVFVLLVTAGLGVITYRSVRGSEQQLKLGEAAVALVQNPDLSLSKAVEAFRLVDDPASRSAVLEAASNPRSRIIAGPGAANRDMTVAGIEVVEGDEHVVAFDRLGRVLVLDGTGAQVGTASVSGLAGDVADVALAPGASRVAVATDRGELAVVDVGTGRQVDIPTDGTSGATVSWLGSAVDGLVLVVGTSGAAATYSAASGSETIRFPGSVIEAIGIDDGRRVVTSEIDARLRVWDAGTGELLAESAELGNATVLLKPFGHSVTGVSVSTGSGGEIVVWSRNGISYSSARLIVNIQLR